MLTSEINDHLSKLAAQGLLRRRIQAASDTPGINFSSNDYLSLSHDTRLKKAYQRGFREYGIGAQGSMFVCGYHAIHRSLEQAFADALSVDACLLFPSGYIANLSVINLLAKLSTHLVIDKEVHASIYDGIHLAKIDYTRFTHNNTRDCQRKLTKPSVLITEAIFSMSGQYAPLTAYSKLKPAYLQGLVVDEAHAFGVYGNEGLGGVVAHQLTQQQVPLRIIPLGKAAAGVGAIVAGNGVWIEGLLQTARSYHYTTAMSPAYAYGLLASLELIRAADERRRKLNQLVTYFRQTCQNSTLKWADSDSPIQQLQLGCPHVALQIANRLQQDGIFCIAMRQPTVNKQQTGLRIVLNYHHEPEQIDYLFACLQRLIHEN